jgi:Zn-dependent peptidase ImmA (M78 family)
MKSTAQVHTDRTHACVQAAERALHRFTQTSNDARIPVPIESLAKWMGFQVVMLHSVPDEFSGLVSPAQKLIGINGNHHPHRRRFSVAHELAHILLRHPAESRCTPGQVIRYNLEADTCASHLLIPRAHLQQAMVRLHSLSALSRLFDVSEEAMSRRLKPVAS